MESWNHGIMENGETKLLNICHIITVFIGTVIIFASLSVYFGILFNIPGLTSISSNINMEINTATCFLLTGSALLVISKRNPGFITRIVFDVISISILLISSITIYEYMSGVDLGIDQLVANYMSRSQGTMFTGQMTFISAICFILIAVTFIFVLEKWVSIWIVQTFAFLVMLLALFSLFHYLYRYNNNYYIKYTSVQAALLFIMTSIGIVLKFPHSGIIGILTKDNYSGYLLRRAVPLTIILAILLFFLELFIKTRGLLNSDTIVVVSEVSIFFIIGITTLFASIILSRKDKKLEEYQMQVQHNAMIFHQFAKNIDLVFYTTSPDLSQMLYVSPAYEKIWGKSIESLYKNPKDWFESILPEDQKKAYKAFFTGFKKEDYSAFADYRIKRPDGSIRSILTRLYKVKDESHNVFCIIGIAVDMSSIKIGKVCNQIDHDTLLLIENEKNIEEFTPKFLKMICRAFDWDLAELWLIDKAKNRLRCIDVWHKNDVLLNDFSKKSRQSTFGLGEGLPGRIWNEKKAVWISDYTSTKAFSRSNEARIAGLKSALAFPIIFQDRFFGVIEFFSHYLVNPDPDLSDLMENIGKKIGDFLARIYSIEQIYELSRQDALTKLLNRSALEDDIDHLIVSQKPKYIAVMVLDIDRFKLINEAYGHEFGDILLNLIAIRLRKFSEVKTMDIARLGADKFILYISESNKEDAFSYAQLINHKFREPFELDNNKIYITATLGIAIYPQDGLDSKSLVMNADLAMIHAKDQGGNRINFFTKELPFVTSTAIAMEADLRQVINGNQLILAYQPQVDLKSGKICAAEVLVRWQHPTRGLINPGIFIPYAEKIGFIVSLNEHIMRMVFQQISLMAIELPVSINISAQQFDNGFHIVEYLESLIKEYPVLPKQIELEITENMLTRDTEHNIAVLTAIHELGFEISIDDFGTGFSSFNYLKRLPVHKIKIDKSFITGLPVDLANAKIVKAIIAMVHSLDKIVVAEGAETKAEVEFLIQEKCDMVQGFYYFKPMPFNDLADILVKTNVVKANQK
ncbi:EAL domain-containing protein [Legionella sp. WA2024007413]